MYARSMSVICMLLCNRRETQYSANEKRIIRAACRPGSAVGTACTSTARQSCATDRTSLQVLSSAKAIQSRGRSPVLPVPEPHNLEPPRRPAAMAQKRRNLLPPPPPPGADLDAPSRRIRWVSQIERQAAGGRHLGDEKRMLPGKRVVVRCIHCTVLDMTVQQMPKFALQTIQRGCRRGLRCSP